MTRLQPIEQKLVSFQGQDIMAVKANNQKIYVGVKWICAGLGLDVRRQREKLQRHETLSKGVATLPLPSSGGVQETLVIDIDFLPLWLATLNPSLVSDDAKDKLLDYQLKAKDVLAEAFLKDHKVRILDPKEALIKSLKLTAETAEKVELIEKKVNLLEQKVEEQITLDSGEQRVLQKAIAKKVYEIESDPEIRRELFRQLHREIKDRWAVASYRDVRRNELQQVLKYVEAWMPRRVS